MTEVFPESNFTPASDWCPHPERWHAVDCMATEVEVLELIAALVRAIQPELVIETGTHRGFGSESIGHALKANGHGRLITLEVDPLLHAEASARTVGLPVECLLQSSLDYTPPAPIDFAFFDSETTLRTGEYTYLREWMHDRTIVAFHDTSPHHGYRPQLDALDLHLLDIPTPRGLTIGRVHEAE